MTETNTEQAEKRGPGRPRKAPDVSQSAASSGEPKAETVQSETSTAAVTSAEQPTTPGNEPDAYLEPETPAQRELREKMEAKMAEEPERGPHPYQWRLAAPAIVPFHFRAPETGEPSTERIEAHIQDCWRVGTAPSIAGVLISEK